MPKLVEEKEDVADGNNYSSIKHHSSSSCKMSCTDLVQQPITANKGSANQHTNLFADSIDNREAASQLPEICENGMGPPNSIGSTNGQSTNHLLGVPDHFLSATGPAPDLTQSSEDTLNSGPDLLRVDNTSSRSSSMPPLSPELKQQEDKQEMDASTISQPKVEDDITETISHPHRIYGRFSAADESQVK